MEKKPLNTKKQEQTFLPPESFETATAELEQIVTNMEAGKMSLEEALSAYKRGMELLQYCQHVLKKSQQQIKILETDILKNFVTPEQNAS
jgi:exodeoxyribonuclease VII small subunit